jgi:serine/threonine protein kinase
VDQHKRQRTDRRHRRSYLVRDGRFVRRVQRISAGSEASELGAVQTPSRTPPLSPAAQPATLEIAPALPYRIGEPLGAGGMGQVFRGTKLCAEGVECAVALKRMHPGLAFHAGAVARFIREAQIMCRMCHSNIVSALAFERDASGAFVLVLERVDGVDLAKLIATGPLPHEVIIFIAMEMLHGLSYAHNLPAGEPGGCGVVHRDLSPDNVLLSWWGEVKISDFGVAKLCEAGNASASEALQGKIAFMSPEQANGRPLDGRSDLFSVGIMLWEMLTGQRLFRRDGEDAKTTLCRVLAKPIAPPSDITHVAPDLEAVVMRLLERDPDLRYANASAAGEALAACVGASGRGRLQLGRVMAERLPRRAPNARSPTVPPIVVRHRTPTVPRQLRPRMRWRTRVELWLRSWWWPWLAAAGHTGTRLDELRQSMAVAIVRSGAVVGIGLAAGGFMAHVVSGTTIGSLVGPVGLGLVAVGLVAVGLALGHRRIARARPRRVMAADSRR